MHGLESGSVWLARVLPLPWLNYSFDLTRICRDCTVESCAGPSECKLSVGHSPKGTSRKVKSLKFLLTFYQN